MHSLCKLATYINYGNNTVPGRFRWKNMSDEELMSMRDDFGQMDERLYRRRVAQCDAELRRRQAYAQKVKIRNRYSAPYTSAPARNSNNYNNYNRQRIKPWWEARQEPRQQIKPWWESSSPTPTEQAQNPYLVPRTQAARSPRRSNLLY